MNKFFAEFATTGARIAVSLALWLVTILTALVGMMLGRIDANALKTLDHIGVGLLIAMGVDVVQYIGKRVTFEPEAHATPLRGDTTPARDDATPLVPPAIAQPTMTSTALPVDESLRDAPPRAAPMARPSHAG